MTDAEGRRRSSRGPARARATMTDVARLAGVSQTTVSFVVNDTPGTGIPEDTKARVLAAVDQLDYRRNRSAANLRLRSSSALGFHVSRSMLDRRDLFSLTLLPALVEAADAHGYQITAFAGDGDELARMDDLARTRTVDGFILVDPTYHARGARYLADIGVPCASLGRLAPDLPQNWVDLDNRAAMVLALEYLAARGHQYIAFVMPSASGRWWDERESAYHGWARSTGRPSSKIRVLRGTPADLVTKVRTVLERRVRPTALLAAGDAVAVSCYRAAIEAGLSVGTDLAVVGFDPLLWMLDPPLTTLTIPFDEVAGLLVSRVKQQIESGEAPRRGVLVQAELRLGRSA